MKKRLYINDLFLNIFIILLCLIIPFALTLKKNDGGVAVISYDSDVVKRINLEDNYVLCNLHGVNITVKDGEVFVSGSSCPDQLCVNMKKAKNIGDSIICVPNRVSVRIEGVSKDGEADVVAG